MKIDESLDSSLMHELELIDEAGIDDRRTPNTVQRRNSVVDEASLETNRMDEMTNERSSISHNLTATESKLKNAKNGKHITPGEQNLSSMVYTPAGPNDKNLAFQDQQNTGENGRDNTLESSIGP